MLLLLPGRKLTLRVARAMDDANLPGIMWYIHLPMELSTHVNHLKKTNLPQEAEMLFVPYSVFTVLKVEWKEKNTLASPHVIHLMVRCTLIWHAELAVFVSLLCLDLQASFDNKEEAGNLDLAPWC